MRRLLIPLLCIAAALALAITAIYWLVTQPWVGARAFAAPAVDSSRLEAHVRMLSEQFHPRSFDRPYKLNQAADYIRFQLEGTGGRVAEQVFPVQERHYRNIIARYGPRQGPMLVIGAHYDAYADAQVQTPGADDNASGIAGLIELGRLLGQHAPAAGVELVAYCLEEPPHFRTEDMGSAWHAKALRASGRPVALVLALEMIGYYDDKPGSQSYPLDVLARVYPDTGNFIAVAGRVQDWKVTRRIKALMRGASDLPVYSINALPLLPGIDFSDHINYWHEGFAALMITDTAFYRNPNYHAVGDTADRLDYQRMAKVVQGVYAVTQHGP